MRITEKHKNALVLPKDTLYFEAFSFGRVRASQNPLSPLRVQVKNACIFPRVLTCLLGKSEAWLQWKKSLSQIKKGWQFGTFVKQFQQRTAMLNAFKKPYGVPSYGISYIKDEPFFLLLSIFCAKIGGQVSIKKTTSVCCGKKKRQALRLVL